jgi:hypothetical protein
VTSFSPLYLIVKIESSKPILSITPEVITVSSSISNNWNFKDELPAFTEIIFDITFKSSLLILIHYNTDKEEKTIKTLKKEEIDL